MLWVILDEGVLRRPVGNPEVMVRQLGRLAEAAQQANVVIQVIPPAVYLDTAARGQIIDDPDDIAAMTVMWETLKAEALSRAASQELIKEVAKSWT